MCRFLRSWFWEQRISTTKSRLFPPWSDFLSSWMSNLRPLWTSLSRLVPTPCPSWEKWTTAIFSTKGRCLSLPRMTMVLTRIGVLSTHLIKRRGRDSNAYSSLSIRSWSICLSIAKTFLDGIISSSQYIYLIAYLVRLSFECIFEHALTKPKHDDLLRSHWCKLASESTTGVLYVYRVLRFGSGLVSSCHKVIEVECEVPRVLNITMRRKIAHLEPLPLESIVAAIGGTLSKKT